jgi:peroxiredoxin Q/BCP
MFGSQARGRRARVRSATAAWVLLVGAAGLLAGCKRAGEPPLAKDTGTSGSVAAPAAGELAKVGADAPNIEAIAHTGDKVSLAALRGKPVVLYFYPKDDTPGCTKEACELRDAWTDLAKSGAVVLGVSTDGQESHVAFAQKYKLPFLLLPDEDQRICRAYGVPVRLGFAKRVTFIIDRSGKIARVFPDVTPTGHAAEILAVLSTLST